MAGEVRFIKASQCGKEARWLRIMVTH